MTKRIVLLASDGVQALDVTGPASVFSEASRARTGEAIYAIDVVSPRGAPIQTVSGVTLGSRAIADAPSRDIDTLLVAGHDKSGTANLIANRAAKDWVADAARHARRWGSVCSGTFPLAAWGLLSGKTVATHWSRLGALADEYPDIVVDEDSLYVVDGRVWTSAGVTAGIDMSLAMVEADHGASLAAHIARRLVVYLRRPGTQSQFSSPLKSQYAASGRYADLIAWAANNLRETLTVDALANRAGQSPRTFQRRFAQQIGRTPAAVIEDLRLDRAKALIACDVPLQTVATEIGYASSSQLTAAFRRRFGVAPSVWKAMHCTPPDRAA